MATACGGSSGGSSLTSTVDGGSGGGVATTSSLTSVPSTDITSIDYSTSSTSSSSLRQAWAVKSDVMAETGGPKFLGEGLADTGSNSRAGCEYNMMKKEIKREGFMQAQAKCAADAMSSAGLIDMPEAGASVTYLIDPPDITEDQQDNFCDDIEIAEQKTRCEAGEGGHGPGGDILMTLSRASDGELSIDVCEEGVKIMEGEYTTSGSVYTVDVRSIFAGFFEEGGDEKMRFSGTIDVGSNGSVTDSVVSLGTDGTAEITVRHVGSFGSGRMIFTADGTSKENEIKAYWSGSFTDPNSNTTNSFEDKIYAKIGATTGCAKFEFSGDMPPESVANMVPSDIASDNLSNFLSALSGEIGIQLTQANYETTYICMNPDYDWEDPDPAEKPMRPLKDNETSCPDVNHSDVECFSHLTINATTDYGTETKQIFTVVANGSATQFDAVNAYDLSTISTTIETPAYSRSTECSTVGSTSVAFNNLTQAQAITFETKMQRCFELAEHSQGDGMEDHDCGGQMMNEAVNDFSEADQDWCYAGGDHSLDADEPPQCPQLFFNDCITDTESDGNGDYCMPSYDGCGRYTLTAGAVSDVSLPIDTAETGGEATVTDLTFTGGTTACTALTATFLVSESSVTCNYTCSQPSFEAPPDEGGFTEYVEGAEAGEAGFFPQPCLDVGITDPQICEGFCIGTGEC